MSEARDIKLKRLKMRSMRRGIKEMDIVLSAFADIHLQDLSDADLRTYDALLSENDHDIFGWIMGTIPVPTHYKAMMDHVSSVADGVVKDGSSSV